MKYTKEQSDKYLKQIQEKMDATGKTIGFRDIFIKTKPPSISHTIGTALNMNKTITHGKRNKREQNLGVSRSLQDLYLIVKHYFPEATIFDVVADLQNRRNKKELRAQFCYSHKKMMFYNNNCPYNLNSKDLSHYGIF